MYRVAGCVSGTGPERTRLPVFRHRAKHQHGQRAGRDRRQRGQYYFADATTSRVRVIYAGGANAAANPMYTSITANNVGVTPALGFVYSIAGGGAGIPAAAPALGSSLVLPNQVYKIAIGPGGNLYLGDSSAAQVFLYDISTGFLRVQFKTNTPCAAHVAGSAVGDGCPVNGFSLSGANGLGIAPDPLGNLYVMDQGALLRKVEAVSLIPTTVGSQTAAGAALTQTLQFHGRPVGTASVTATVLNDAPDILVGAVNCAAANADATRDCTVPVTFAPTQPVRVRRICRCRR